MEVGLDGQGETDSDPAVLDVHHTPLAAVLGRAQHEAEGVRRVDLCQRLELREGGVEDGYILRPKEVEGEDFKAKKKFFFYFRFQLHGISK